MEKIIYTSSRNRCSRNPNGRALGVEEEQDRSTDVVTENYNTSREADSASGKVVNHESAEENSSSGTLEGRKRSEHRKRLDQKNASRMKVSDSG